ncbi:MAG: hypothetical protein KAW17_03200 [Candidatus Eisenbacteria sp.]|nr:hypothetical protein [Candidatus Eisenbacteria bacterium]
MTGHNYGNIGLTTRVVGPAVCGAGILLYFHLRWYEAARDGGWVPLWWLIVLAGLAGIWTLIVRWQVIGPIRGLSLRRIEDREAGGASERDFPPEFRFLDEGLRDILRGARESLESERESARTLEILTASLTSQWRTMRTSAGVQARLLEEGQVPLMDDWLECLGDSVNRLGEYLNRLENGTGEVAGLLEGVICSCREGRASASEYLVRGREFAGMLDEADGRIRIFQRATETAASLVTKVNDVARQVTSSCRELKHSTRDLNRVATEGEKVLKEANVHARHTSEAVLESAESVRNLGSRSGEIGSVVEVIESIADETNLLALNAAIIAAQAGEHGRSFAVVAEEIRELAERTSSSTKEVADLVKSVQDGIGQAAQSIDESAKKVRQSANLGAQAGEIWEQVRKSSEQNARLAEGIVSSSSEQSRDADRLGSAMDGVEGYVTEIAEKIRGRRRAEEEALGRLSALESSLQSVSSQEGRISSVVSGLEEEVGEAGVLLAEMGTWCARGKSTSAEARGQLGNLESQIQKQLRLLETQGETLRVRSARANPPHDLNWEATKVSSTDTGIDV